MNNNIRILFVVEGSTREMRVFDNISQILLNGRGKITYIPVPAEMNIYMLYRLMKKDSFQTDIVELLKEKVPRAKKILEKYNRDSFAEVYYFFDYDEHAKNLRKTKNIDALKEMLSNLNNETELGKLYISYPMVEALRDCHIGCKPFNGNCFIHRADFGLYKQDSSKNNEYNDICSYSYRQWISSIRCFIYRMACLFKMRKLNRNDFINLITPSSLLSKQLEYYIPYEIIFIASCVPEFLIDYSSIFWNAAVQNRKKPILEKRCQFTPSKSIRTGNK